MTRPPTDRDPLITGIGLISCLGEGEAAHLAALDATLLSRTGRAIGVDELGKVLGVTSFDRLRTAIHAADEAAAEAAAADGRPAPAEVQA